MLKLGITMNEELASRMDEYAAENYMTRSGVISMAVSQFLNAKDMSKTLKELTAVLKEIAAKEIVDDDSLQRLEDIDRAVKLLSGETLY